MGLVEFVVGLHHAPHHIDEVPENLAAAHAVEVGRAGEALFQREGEVCRQRGDVRRRVGLVGGHARQIVAAHLGPGFQHHPQVGLIPIVALHEIGHRPALGHRPVAVAELPVVVALEQRPGGVAGNGKCVNKSVGGLDGAPQKVVEAVLVDALAGDGAVHAPEAPAREGEVPQVYHPAGMGQGGPEIGDHGGKARVTGGAVGHDDHVFVPFFGRFGQGGAVSLPRRGTGGGRRRDKEAVPAGENQLVEEVPGLPAALFAQQVLHVCRETPHRLHPQVKAVLLHPAVGGHVVEVFGGGDLAGEFARKVRPALLHQLHKAVQLIGCEEGVDRVAEEHQVRLFQRGAGGSKIFFVAFDAHPHRQVFKGVLRVQRLQIQRRVQRGGGLALGAAVQHENVHSSSSNSFKRRLYHCRSNSAAAMPYSMVQP